KYYGHTETVEIAMIGINDAPELAGATVFAAEDGAAVSLDLSTLGFDVDSDDDGSTLTYSIVGLSEAADVTLNGSILSFDPGAGYQMLNDGDVHEIIVTIQAVDSHGAVSNTQEVVLAIEGRDDPRPDYQNADGSVNYDALGVDPAGAFDHGTLSGVDGKASNLDLIGFSEDDDMNVVVADIIEIFGDYDFFYDFYGIELYDDLTFDTGAGSDTLVFYQHSAGDLAYLGLTDVRTGTGEDVVVIDSSASGISWLEGVNINTGEHNDQVLISLESGASQVIEGGDFATGAGNDLVSIQMNETGDGQTGFSSILMADFYLGDGNDELLIDINGKEAVWANVRADIYAGAGDDHVVIDNADTTMSETYPYPGFMMSGLDGDIDLGAGDDVLDIDVTALDGEGAEALIIGGEGYDIVNLLGGEAGDYEITENSYPGSYTVTTSGQTYFINDVEEINLADGTTLV
ncbi:MAG: Ig-like domain-containing protein, partial [Alphaproteobacteria bacterium]|nr:Ig-like domain-containing protein [Alphaproteobacteria bacterium]